MKYVGKYRLMNISQFKTPIKLNHVFSAIIVKETESKITVQIDNTLDDKDSKYIGYEFDIPIRDFNHNYQQYLTKNKLFI